MRYTMATVGQIVQAACCSECGESHPQAMVLVHPRIMCATCAAAEMMED